MARPTKYNEETAKRICDLLQIGASQKTACGSVGITEDTFGNWIKRNSDFSDRARKAQADYILNMTAVVTRGAKDDPALALKVLERRDRNEWGANIAVRADRELEAALAALFPEEAGRNAPAPAKESAGD
jgi:hypothetical protein